MLIAPAPPGGRWWRNPPAATVHFLLILAFELFLHQFFLLKHYTCDSYYQIYDQKKNTIELYSDAGRGLSALLTWCVDALHLNLVTDQVLFTLLAIILLSVAVFSLTSSALALKGAVSGMDKTLFTLAALLVINSSFSVENMLFNALAPFHALAMVLLALSVKALIERSSFFEYGLIVCAATLLYQGYLGLFAPVAAVFLMCRHADSLKRYVLSLAGVAAGCGFSILATVLYKRFPHRLVYGVGEGGREMFVTDPGRILDNLAGIVAYQKTIWIENCSLLPKYSLLIFLLVSLAVFFAVNKGTRNSGRAAVMLTGVIFSAFAMSFLPHLFAAVLWMMPRSINGISALPGIIFLAALLRMESDDTGWWGKALMAGSLAVPLLLVSWFTLRIERDTQYANRMDDEYALLLSQEIARQETGNGIPVSKLAFVRDAQPKWYYDNSIAFGSINQRSSLVAWSLPSLLRMNTGKIYEVREISEEVYNTYFKDRNWDSFDKEQVVVVGDTANVSVY